MPGAQPSAADVGGDGAGSGQGGLRPRWLLLALLVVGVYAGVVVFIGGEDARDAIIQASPWPLVGALLAQVVVTLVWPLVHRASLRAVGADIAYWQALQVSMSSFTVSHVVPGGGAAGAAAAVERLNRFGIPGPTATASATLTGPISLSTILAVGAVGIAGAVAAGDLTAGYLALAVGALAIVVTVVSAIVYGLRSPAAGDRVIALLASRSRRMARRADDWRTSWRAVTDAAPSPRDLLGIYGWSVVKWGSDIASLALVFLAFGHEPRLTTLLVGFGVSQALSAVPSTPGAVGVLEGGLIAAFVALGVPFGLAATVAITYRVLETWVPTIAGIPIVLRPRQGNEDDGAGDGVGGNSDRDDRTVGDARGS